MKKVLVAEDEAAIREFIVINLTRGGYNVTQAENGAQALQMYEYANGDFDVALLDVMMPEMDGLTLCKELRKRSNDLGIIILSAKTQEMDKVTGLLNGADDYVAKPFSPSELIARVDAVHRRVQMIRGSKSNEIPSEVVVLDNFELNIKNRTLTKNGRLVDLTQVEFQIIEYFFRNPNAALSRTDILNHVWGSNYIGEEKIVDVNIRRIRMKIEDNPSSPQRLATVWGLGYKWITDDKR